MKTYALSLLLTLLLFCFSSHSALLQELTAQERETLQSNQLILKTQKTEKNSSWPEVTIYKLINANALESMGIFAALDYQANYVPNLISSVPEKHLSATEVLTRYEMKTPWPLPNAKYLHGSRVIKDKENYRLEWWMVESNSTDEVKGSAEFENFEGKTIFRYRVFIQPKSIFAKLVKNIMLKDVQKSVQAIAEHIEKLKESKSDLIPKYSNLVNRQLNGEMVYAKVK